MLTYQAALDYLYSFIDYGVTRAVKYSASTFNLDRMARLLELLGQPHQRYPALHIAGTKGKGSVSAMCASILRASGLRTGLYTSPHLHDFRERIQINGDLIPPEAVADIVTRLQTLEPRVPGITTFELTTALAFEYFARAGVEAAVIEVGLGGRLDATNTITPRVSVITSLSYDHTELLGATLDKIAFEKGGIIKPGVPVITAPQAPEALAVLECLAAERQAPLTVLGRHAHTRPVRHDLRGQTFELWGDDLPPVTLTTPLLGAHQVENAALACLAVRASGLNVPGTALTAGLAATVWPGRFEVLPGAPTVILDGAHNRDSARRLAETVRAYFPNTPVALVFGASTDKDIAGMSAELQPVTHQVVVTQAVHPRAAVPATLAAHFAPLPVEIVPTVPQALQRALELAVSNAVVLVCGSLFIVAEARAAWHSLPKPVYPAPLG